MSESLYLSSRLVCCTVFMKTQSGTPRVSAHVKLFSGEKFEKKTGVHFVENFKLYKVESNRRNTLTVRL